MTPHASSNGTFDQGDMRFLVEKNADGIIVLDHDGIVLFANPAAGQIFGRSPESLIGSPIGIPMSAGETTEIAIRKANGLLIETEIRIVDTVWERRSAWLASLRDVSARKAMEERLRHTAKMEAIGRLTAGIAHDFNNLLTVVLGNLEIARRELAPDDASRGEALENARRGAERAAGLTERLLAFARRKPLEPRTIDVNDLVSGMSDLLRRALGEEIRVVTRLMPELWRVDADSTELEAAILNLAVNSRDAMPEGGELRIETGQARLFGEAEASRHNLRPGAYVVVSVADGGVGMSEAILKQVFEPFFTTKGGRGTGLGLSQVYGFATQSGGTVSLESRPGEGTTARIYLPRSDGGAVADPVASAAPVPRALPRGQAGETILVVEDDIDVRRYTTGTLREFGYTVFEACGSREALAVLETEPFVHLLLTDLGLPEGMDGRALGEEARRRRPSLKVLITTAYAAASLVHNDRLDAGVDLLTKPFTRAALATRVRQLLDTRLATATAPRVLLVEDEVLVRLYARQMLTDLGCEVWEAGSSAEAQAKLHEARDGISAAIIDLGLPDRPGKELVAEIRAARPRLPIVLTTGYVDETVRRQVADDRMTIIVDKPYQPHDLGAALERLGISAKRA